tara:strand:+ start:4507 stop:4818 length:312 start_codon:yes stop_codon:yes gene_type:complete
MENQEQERQFTPEELETKRKEMLKYYKESLVYLKAQYEHEELLCKIDEVRFKRSNIQMQYAMMMNQMEEGEKEEQELTNEEYPHPTPSDVMEKNIPFRKLKKD